MPRKNYSAETQELLQELHDLFHCDFATGKLFWKRHRWGRMLGKEAGTKRKSGYIMIAIPGYIGRHIYAHRIIFAMYNGYWPKDEVDHNDRDRTNNKPTNLIDAGPSRNQLNSTANSSATGIRGVYKNHNTGKPFKASIMIKGQNIHLGYFDTLEDAKEAREAAERKALCQI